MPEQALIQRLSSRLQGSAATWYGQHHQEHTTVADFLQTLQRRYVASATAHEDLRRSMESLSLFGGCGNNLPQYVEQIEQDAELYAVLAPQELGQAQIDRDAVRAALCNLTGDVLTALHARMPNQPSLDTIPRATLFTHLSAIAAQRRVRPTFRRGMPPLPPPPRVCVHCAASPRQFPFFLYV